jgi:acetyl esterase/lipase
MKHLYRTAAWLLALCSAATCWGQAPAKPEAIPLWPGAAPGEKGDIGEEKDTTKPDPNVPPDSPDYIIRLGNVSTPTISVYKPPAGKDTGAAVVVCPGGGYSILAMNLEGTEVCQWLNSLGVTGVLLKYRVPARKGLEKHTAALQDVQRAVGITRHRAKEWKIDPKRIGVLGFSAGGHLAAAASNNFGERTYPAVDDADKETCRPDFAVLVYPAYLAQKQDMSKLAPEMHVTGQTPPTFIAMTQDDPIGIENVYTYAAALKNAKVPCEAHVYPVGGHGYGLRPSKNPVSTAWPKLAADWMAAQGLLKPAGEAAKADAKPAGGGTPRWYKGNLHTHSLWSDGDQFPEPISLWYREHGYQFLAISDHNTLQRGEKWVKYADLLKKGAAVGLDQYLRDFPAVAKVRGDRDAGRQEVRLTPLKEYRPLLERPGEFLLIQSEEITEKFGTKPELPVHLNAANLAQKIKPQGGSSVAQIISNNLRAVREQSDRLKRPMLVHLNHPNFGWGVTAQDLAEATEERFFEVYNGHPGVNQLGDKTHLPVERIWDVANTARMLTYGGEPLMGLGTDDTHHYHVGGMTRATAGRGWVNVRARELTAAALIAAIQAGDFYASTGVTLADVRFDTASKTLRLDIQPDGDAKFTTRFVGTVAPSAATESGKSAVPAAQDVGVVFASADGLAPTYRLTGRELYVRAVVTSDRPPLNPSFKGQLAQAWTQPVGWQQAVRN